MRYIIHVFPLHIVKPITTDFKLIAFCIAFLIRLIYSAVYVIDCDTGELIFSTRKKRSAKQIVLPASSRKAAELS